MNKFETQTQQVDPFEFTEKQMEALLEGQPAGSIQVMAFSDVITLKEIHLKRSNQSHRSNTTEYDFKLAAVNESIRNRTLSPEGPEYKIAQDISRDLLDSCTEAFDNPNGAWSVSDHIVRIGKEKLNEHLDRLVSERAETLGNG